MLQKMRDKMQGIIAGVIVFLIAITFALWGIQYYSHGFSEHGIIAKVNGEKITEQELHRAYTRAQQQNLALMGKESYFDQKNQAALKEKVTEQTIKNKVLTALSNSLGLYVGKEQLQATIMDLPMFQDASAGGFSAAKFQQMLGNLSYSEQEFSRELQGFLLLSQFEYGIKRSAFALPNEINAAIKLLKQSRDFDYCILVPEHFSAEVAVSEEEIKKYYEQHQKEFSTPEKVSIEYIELNADVIKSKLNPTDAELQQFHRDHAALFNQKDVDKKQIRAAYEHNMVQQLLAEQSDKLADLTYTNSGSLEPAATELGLTIKSTGFFTQKGVKGASADTSKATAVPAKKTALKNGNNGKSSNKKGEIAKHDSNNKNILANHKIVKAAFSESVLQQSYNSSPIEIADNDVVVLRIKKRIPEAVIPLDKVRTEIITAVKKEKALALIKESATKILQALQANDTNKAAALGKKYGVTWQKVKGGTRTSSLYDKRILDRVFSLLRPDASTTNAQAAEGKAAVVDLQEKGYAIIKIVNVHDSNPANTSVKEQQTIGDALQSSFGQFDYSLLTNFAMQKAKIKIYEEPTTTHPITDDE